MADSAMAESARVMLGNAPASRTTSFKKVLTSMIKGHINGLVDTFRDIGATLGDLKAMDRHGGNYVTRHEMPRTQCKRYREDASIGPFLSYGRCSSRTDTIPDQPRGTVSSFGSGKTTFSLTPSSERTFLAPRLLSLSTTSKTNSSGADAPAVTPTLPLPAIHDGSI